MSTSFIRRSVTWSVLILTIVVLGCNSKKSHHVSGTVSYKGEPVPAGIVWFDPDHKNNAPQGFAYIKNGEYSTAKDGGRGVNGGAYIIRIEAFDGKPGHELPMGKALSTNFQKPIELPHADSTQNFEIPEKQ